jgi:hypothetical protein
MRAIQVRLDRFARIALALWAVPAMVPGAHAADPVESWTPATDQKPGETRAGPLGRIHTAGRAAGIW